MDSLFICFLFLSTFITYPSSSSSSSPPSSPSSPATITLSLTPTYNPNITSSNPWEFISHITKSSLARAHHLKNTSSSVLHHTENTPLSPRSYGGYSVSFSFGTPPQTIPLVFDTGSSLLWVPCTSNYLCTNCSLPHVDPTKIVTFKPKLSSTKQIIGCMSPKCSWIYGPDLQTRCPGCRSNQKQNLANCTKPCPTYLLQYGLGSTLGLAISDNLNFLSQVVPDFLFGCSVVSTRQPEGIAGFGRVQTSLPSQLKLSKFSYCLVSHSFDDQPKSSDLILTGAGKPSGNGVMGLSYTPLGKNPEKSPYNEYYYVHLKKITVGKKSIKLPNGLLKPGPKGNGGTIVDSGSTLTFMDRVLFDPVVTELAAQMGSYKRVKEAEKQSGFGLCFNVSGQDNITIPEVVFEFKGGAKMDLEANNYFSIIDDSGTVCLTIISVSSPIGPQLAVGPAIIIGNFQQMNFYIEYDLKNKRLGFKKQKCG